MTVDTASEQERIELGILGGTGFYEFFGHTDEVEVSTERGAPSAPVTITRWAGRTIGFLPRHGRAHEFLPHQVPYPANLAALRSLGARQILGFNVVGSLSPGIGRGDLVLIDQFIDTTWGRDGTVLDGVDAGHADTAEPYCARLRGRAGRALEAGHGTVHRQATVVVINGPRFQTKAESRMYRRWGADLINMTQSTEASVAREMELCYVNLSYCTDYGVIAEDLRPDAGDPPVRHAEIVERFQSDRDRVEAAIAAVVGALDDDPSCPCRTALDGCWTHRASAPSVR